MIKIWEGTPLKLSGLSSIFIQTDYNEQIINVIKTFIPAIWHKQSLVWEVSSVYLHNVLDQLTFYDNITLRLLPKNECITSYKSAKSELHWLPDFLGLPNDQPN